MKSLTMKAMHYTIVEMMMVVAVFMIILSMATVAWLNSGSQARLRNAAREVTGQLNLARAKAVAERTTIGVYFATCGTSKTAAVKAKDDSNPFKDKPASRLYYFDGDTRSSYVDFEEWNTLPGSMSFDFPANDNQPSGKISSKTAYIVFNSKGAVEKHGGFNEFNGGYSMIVVEGSVESAVPENASYYVITINKYTGKITSKLYDETD